MLWNLVDLEPLEITDADYKQLVDNLRACSLQPYYLDARYREAASVELSKVDWAKQPDRMVRLYKKPLWFLKLRNAILKFGSRIKQLLKSVFS